MKIEIDMVFDNGDCWCGNTHCRLIVKDGEILVNESHGSCEWQCGKATDYRGYGQYFCGAERITRWSTSKFFAHLPEDTIRDYVLALVFLGETRGRKSPNFWRLCKWEWDDGKGRLAPATKRIANGYSRVVRITK